MRYGSQRACTLLTQVKDLHSASYLTAKPSGSTELNDEAFSTTLRLRLGLEQLPPGFQCETHNVALDTFAHHALMQKRSRVCTCKARPYQR